MNLIYANVWQPRRWLFAAINTTSFSIALGFDFACRRDLSVTLALGPLLLIVGPGAT